MYAAIRLPSHIDFGSNSSNGVPRWGCCEPTSGWQWMVQRSVSGDIRRGGLERSVAAGYSRAKLSVVSQFAPRRVRHAQPSGLNTTRLFDSRGKTINRAFDTLNVARPPM